MFILKVDYTFSAAHNLREYKGKCEELHGHNWKVEVEVAACDLDKTGMVMDFHEIKDKLKAVLEQFDHKYLNEHSYFKNVNPTSENISKYIYDCLKSKISNLKSVTVWENDSCCATYEL